MAQSFFKKEDGCARREVPDVGCVAQYVSKVKRVLMKLLSSFNVCLPFSEPVFQC